MYAKHGDESVDIQATWGDRDSDDEFMQDAKPNQGVDECESS